MKINTKKKQFYVGVMFICVSPFRYFSQVKKPFSKIFKRVNRTHINFVSVVSSGVKKPFWEARFLWWIFSTYVHFLAVVPLQALYPEIELFCHSFFLFTKRTLTIRQLKYTLEKETELLHKKFITIGIANRYWHK